MKCSTCGATDHFRANCPQSGKGGKGGGGERSVTFGFTSAPSSPTGTAGAIQLAVMDSGAGNREAVPAMLATPQASSAPAAPPWGDEIYEPPREIFVVAGSQAGSDQVFANDPWQSASAVARQQQTQQQQPT